MRNPSDPDLLTLFIYFLLCNGVTYSDANDAFIEAEKFFNRKTVGSIKYPITIEAAALLAKYIKETEAAAALPDIQPQQESIDWRLRGAQDGKGTRGVLHNGIIAKALLKYPSDLNDLREDEMIEAFDDYVKGWLRGMMGMSPFGWFSTAI